MLKSLQKGEVMKKIIIGSRGSVLALWQANHIAQRLKHECHIESEIRIVKTQGDKILDVPLAKIGGKGLFTKELEELLLKGEIDLAVHSLKDVPVFFPEGLKLVAITQREDVRDCFLSYRYKNLDDLPLGAKVGTTSLRRSMQIKAKRVDLDTQSLRGNVQTRLERLKKGEFDAIILAQAGVNRLQIKGVEYIQPIAIKEMIPAMGQGALGLECREDSQYFSLFESLNDEKTKIFCECEREFIKMLEGGCQVPIGIHAYEKDGKLEMIGKIGLPNGEKVIALSTQGELSSHLQLAQTFAREFEDRGAREILNLAAQMI